MTLGCQHADGSLCILTWRPTLNPEPTSFLWSIFHNSVQDYVSSGNANLCWYYLKPEFRELFLWPKETLSSLKSGINEFSFLLDCCLDYSSDIFPFLSHSEFAFIIKIIQTCLCCYSTIHHSGWALSQNLIINYHFAQQSRYICPSSPTA